jgi:hypothetical protein
MEGLRERNSQNNTQKHASSANSGTTSTPANVQVEKPKKTFGRTPDGTSKLGSLRMEPLPI